jgi:excisionase family DNA binding protein
LAELEDFMTVAQAAKVLGLTPTGVRTAINEGRLKRTLLHKRTSLIAREEVERYRREHLGRQGKRPQPEGLTEQQRKQRAYQRAYYQRKKAARMQPATEPAQEEQQRARSRAKRGKAGGPAPQAEEAEEAKDRL